MAANNMIEKDSMSFESIPYISTGLERWRVRFRGRVPLPG